MAVKDFVDRKNMIIEAARKGSVKDLETLATHWQHLPNPLDDDIQSIFFHNLNALNPPGHSNSNSSKGRNKPKESTISTESLKAFWSIYALAQIAVKVSRAHGERYGPQFIRAWPGIFKWSTFFLSSEVQLPSTFDGIRSIRDMVPMAWLTISWSSSARNVMDNTPGIQEMAAGLYLLEEDEHKRDTSDPLCFLVGSLLVSITRAKDESEGFVKHVTEAAGGNLLKITRTLLIRLKHAFLSPCFAVAEDRYYCILLFEFITQLCKPSNTEAHKAFLQHSGAVVCINFLIRLASITNDGAPVANDSRKLLSLAANFLGISLQASNETSLVLQVLEAGLLTAFVECSPLYADLGDEEYHIVSDAISRILPKYLTDVSVLKSVDRAFRNLPRTRRFLALRSNRAWEDFNDLALLTGQRLAVLDYSKEIRSAHMKCSNPECSKVDARTNFRKCSACGKVLYCSKECQVADWKPRHRVICQLEEPEDYVSQLLDVSSRGSLYIRALNLYVAHKSRSFLADLAAKEHPGERVHEMIVCINHHLVPRSVSIAVREEFMTQQLEATNWPKTTTLIFGRVLSEEGDVRLVITPISECLWDPDKTPDAQDEEEIEKKEARSNHAKIVEWIDRTGEAMREAYCNL